MRYLSTFLVPAAALVAAGACGVTGGNESPWGPGQGGPDGGGADGTFGPDGTGVTNRDSGTGFGSDGQSADACTSTGCGCAPIGQTTACWTGPPGDRNMGACKDGVMTCLGEEFGTWGPCVGEVLACGVDAGPPPMDAQPPPVDAPPPPDADAGPVLPPQACLPGSAMALLVTGSNVAAYVPNGSWQGGGTGVVVVPIEGNLFTPLTIPTTQNVNSCTSDSTLGQVVCIGNNLTPPLGNDVYVISGATNTITNTLSSAATATESFSGGSCDTCAQAIDPVHHQGFLSIGTAAGAAFQPFNLSTGTLGTPIPAAGQVATSENILIDPSRHLLLSPNENANEDAGVFTPAMPGDYQLVNVSTGAVYDWINPGSSQAMGVFDSAAEDCTTGIALSTLEDSDQLFLTDLTQATYSGSTWSAPFTIQTIADFSTFTAGTNGIAIATNSHLGVVTDEFGGNAFGVIELPATSGSGAPALVDWVAATVPNDPTGMIFQHGFDPHTVTAFTSPTTGRPFAVLSDWPNGSTPTYLVVIDMQALLALPRSAPGAHTLATPLAIGPVVRYIAL
jgi:hypothetical protein